LPRIHAPTERIPHGEMLSQILGMLLIPTGAPPRERGRNEPCPCGSGKKYKARHQAEDDRKRASAR